MMKITRRTRTSTLMRIAEEIYADLQSQSSHATARRLSAPDLVTALLTHRAGLKKAQDDDVAATTRAVGGFVPNSYNTRGSVNGDSVRIETLLETGETAINATWGPGSFRRAGGHGDWCVTRLLREGQAQGRIV